MNMKEEEEESGHDDALRADIGRSSEWEVMTTVWITKEHYLSRRVTA